LEVTAEARRYYELLGAGGGDILGPAPLVPARCAAGKHSGGLSRVKLNSKQGGGQNSADDAQFHRNIAAKPR
jgi:hypothetical protein